MVNAPERRHFWRAAFHSPAEVSTGAGTMHAAVLDISLKGALLELPMPWSGALDEPCRLRLPLADGVEINLSGHFSHIAGRHVGVRCEKIDLDSITHLRRLVELNSGDPALLEREVQMLIGV